MSKPDIISPDKRFLVHPEHINVLLESFRGKLVSLISDIDKDLEYIERLSKKSEENKPNEINGNMLVSHPVEPNLGQPR